MLGGTREQIINAVSNAWIDGGALRTYRHAPNTGSRKSWAAGDATSRAVRHALFALKGEMGYPSALSAKTWGFQDVLFKGKPIVMERPFGSYVMENVLFKISYPAEFHGQTAVEAAMTLHPEIKDKLDARSNAWSSRPKSRARASSTRPDRSRIPPTAITAFNTWSRFRCCSADLTAADYEDAVAQDPRVDALRAKMQVKENAGFTEGVLRADKALHRQCGAGVLQGRHLQPSAWRWISRSDIASGAPRACRCWSRNSKPASQRTSSQADRIHQGDVRGSQSARRQCR
jgi:2-methylcitrate dehydratase